MPSVSRTGLESKKVPTSRYPSRFLFVLFCGIRKRIQGRKYWDFYFLLLIQSGPLKGNFQDVLTQDWQENPWCHRAWMCHKHFSLEERGRLRCWRVLTQGRDEKEERALLVHCPHLFPPPRPQPGWEFTIPGREIK